jgi:hypothetical protein
MDQNKSTTPSNIIRVILVVAVLAIILYGITLVKRSFDRTLRPLQQTNDMLGTQVAELLHPTPTIIPDPVTIIHEVTSLAQLVTIQYTVEKVIRAEENQNWLAPLIGDKLLFVAHGYVTAGIDMQKIKEQDLWLQDGVLKVRLPAAEVFVATLDNEKSYVYDRETGILTKGSIDLESLARQSAEEEIRKAAVEDNILDQAWENAKNYLNWFFEALGYEKVEYVEPTP